MPIMLSITLKASARAAAAILDFAENLAKTDEGAVRIESVEPVLVKARGTKRRVPVLKTPAIIAPIEAPVNPFVAQAVEHSSRRIVPVIRPGRNRVIYTLVSPAPDAVIVGVPARIVQHLAGTRGMSAKDIEVDLGLKRKSVESALYHLRTVGAVESVDITT